VEFTAFPIADGWDNTLLKKVRPARRRPNPRGLRVIEGESQ
jgi:hypothetical protein